MKIRLMLLWISACVVLYASANARAESTSKTMVANWIQQGNKLAGGTLEVTLLQKFSTFLRDSHEVRWQMNPGIGMFVMKGWYVGGSFLLYGMNSKSEDEQKVTREIQQFSLGLNLQTRYYLDFQRGFSPYLGLSAGVTVPLLNEYKVTSTTATPIDPTKLNVSYRLGLEAGVLFPLVKNMALDVGISATYQTDASFLWFSFKSGLLWSF